MRNTVDSNKKIIILGAGLGGLYVAKTLGKLGFSIVIYEKRERAELGYPWHDSIDKDTFHKSDIEIPEDFVLRKQVLNFYSPSGDGYIRQAERASNNFDIDRKKLIGHLISLAEENCEIHFGVSVDSLIVDGDSVIGVTVDGKEEYCDLVIDSTGIFSKYRFQLPKKYLMDDSLLPTDYLMAYRGFYEKTSNEPTPSNVYLMPEGFSVLWCKDAPNTAMSDVFISTFESLTKEQVDTALNYLKERNPHMTDKCSVFVQDAIPVRYPLATIVANGYALIGNSAFMTKPTSGSGIENTLNAAQILCDVIRRADDFTVETLWRYAVRTTVAFGSNCYMAYVARSRFQNLNRDDLIWLFTSGILNESLLAIARFDIPHLNEFKLDSIRGSLQLAKSRPDFIRQIESILRKAARAKLHALMIPRIYNEKIIAKWKAEYDSFARNDL
ncbi:MAG: NAD(P)/FAD-dependent oxidoreductase [Clostridia bacterium]|nr:NAD(P)/FAD-dependent oxidoreductase [Clostridia bacterium]